jgi:hypothetical protein
MKAFTFWISKEKKLYSGKVTICRSYGQDLKMSRYFYQGRIVAGSVPWMALRRLICMESACILEKAKSTSLNG